MNQFGYRLGLRSSIGRRSVTWLLKIFLSNKSDRLCVWNSRCLLLLMVLVFFFLIKRLPTFNVRRISHSSFIQKAKCSFGRLLTFVSHKNGLSEADLYPDAEQVEWWTSYEYAYVSAQSCCPSPIRRKTQEWVGRFIRKDPGFFRFGADICMHLQCDVRFNGHVLWAVFVEL
jgi:hypothetical protein